jgi:hypothetical protein
MNKRIKLAAVFGAATALLLPATQAGAAIGDPTAKFVGKTSVGTLNVKCSPGLATGRLAERLRLSLSGDLSVGGNIGSVGTLGNSTKIVASWAGGSATLTRMGTAFLLSSAARFPCPAVDGDALNLTFQPNRGKAKVGAASQAAVKLNWKGPRIIRQFAGLASVEQINLNACTPGRRQVFSTSQSPFTLKATHTTAGIPAALLGDDLNRKVTKIVASWNGGSATIRRYEQAFTVRAGSRFACPDPARPATRDLKITFQAYVGGPKIGKPASDWVKLVKANDPAVGDSTGPVASTPDVPVTTADSTPPNADDKLDTSVTTPNGGTVNVTESNSPSGTWSSPAGFGFLPGAGEVIIDAPPADSAADPLVLKFDVFAPGVNLAAFGVLRNGVLVAACTNQASGAADPDPCSKKSKTGDVITVTVLTTHASGWNFALKAGNPSQ